MVKLLHQRVSIAGLIDLAGSSGDGVSWDAPLKSLAAGREALGQAPQQGASSSVLPPTQPQCVVAHSTEALALVDTALMRGNKGACLNHVLE